MTYPSHWSEHSGVWHRGFVRGALHCWVLVDITIYPTGTWIVSHVDTRPDQPVRERFECKSDSLDAAKQAADALAVSLLISSDHDCQEFCGHCGNTALARSAVEAQQAR